MAAKGTKQNRIPQILLGLLIVFLFAVILVLLFWQDELSIRFRELESRYDTLQGQANGMTDTLRALSDELETARGQIAELPTVSVEEGFQIAKPEYDPVVDLPYMAAYPELYVDPAAHTFDKPGVVYLTFDDGPSKLTESVLDILEKHGVKATFFIVGTDFSDWRGDLLRRMVEEGHTVAVHSASHEYKKIYASVEAYLEDFSACYQAIYEQTGVKPWAFRFPGGSINAHNRTTYMEIISEMTRRGFVYFDWNVSAEDASNTIDAATVRSNILSYASLERRNVVLCHDTHWHTVEALDGVIRTLKERGHTFAPLTPEVEAVYFNYKQDR